MVSKPGFFFFSDYGSTMFLARRLRQQGHPVLLYVKEAAAAKVGTGLVPKTTNPVPPRGFPFVIFDAVGHGSIGKALRGRGLKVMGANPYDKVLESDRIAGQQVMSEIGVRTPETHEYRSVGAAITFLEKQDGAWFVKQIGADTEEAGTYDGRTVTDLIRYLRWAGNERLKHFQLSKKADGTEISVNGWFNGRDFVRPFDVTLEEKKFLAGNLGRRTGCESNLVWLAQDDLLASRTIAPLEAHLGREGYVGPCDLNSLIDAKGEPIGLEWTARLGFDATQAWCNLFDSTLGEQLAGFLDGTLQKWDAAPDLSVTLRVSMPPYPLWEPTVAAKYAGSPVDAAWLRGDQLTVDDVAMGTDGPQMAGRDGCIGTVGATGDNVNQLVVEVLAGAKKLMVPNKQYRIDPLSRATKDLTALGKLGLVGHPSLARDYGGNE